MKVSKFDQLIGKLGIRGSAIRPGETAKEREARWRDEDLAARTLGEAFAISEAINALRSEEGDSVMICCSNPEGGGPDNEAIEVTAEWTNWQPRRFQGHSLRMALESAVHEKSLQAEKKHAR